MEQRGHGDKWVAVCGLKGFVDGSLNTRPHFKPFTDAPTDSGFFITPEKDLYEWASAADKTGLQVMIHAIGDKAINTLLNIFDRIEKENGPHDRRFRLSMHSTRHLRTLIVSNHWGSSPPCNLTMPLTMAAGQKKVIGRERSKQPYIWFLDESRCPSGFWQRLVCGTANAPRRNLCSGYAPHAGRQKSQWLDSREKITVAQALKAYTNAAYASFEERIKGSLERGKLADLVVLDRDILTIAPEQIRGVKVRGRW